MVDQAGAQPGPAVRGGGRHQDAAVAGQGLGQRPVVRLLGVGITQHPAEADHRERRLHQQLEAVIGGDQLGQQLGLVEVALDRGADRVGAVHDEGQPQLQGAERARVLERAVDRVHLLAVRDVALLVGEGPLQRLDVVDEQHAAGLGHVQPLVRVDGRRVGALKAGEARPGPRGAGRRQPVGAVDVQPHVAPRADVGQRGDVVDRPGQGGPAGRDHGHRDDPLASGRHRSPPRTRPGPCGGRRRSGSRARCRPRCRAPRRRGAPSGGPRPSSTAPSAGLESRPGARRGSRARAPRSARSGWRSCRRRPAGRWRRRRSR